MSENAIFTRAAGTNAQIYVHFAADTHLVNFSHPGAAVANLSAMRTAILLVLLAFPACAQEWSASFGIGPFIFGHFAERTSAIGNEGGTTTTRSHLSAATRAGAAADLERDFGRWLGIRLQASWTRAPLSVKSSGEGVAFDAGRLNVTTFVLPVVVHLNRARSAFSSSAVRRMRSMTCAGARRPASRRRCSRVRAAASAARAAPAPRGGGVRASESSGRRSISSPDRLFTSRTFRPHRRACASSARKMATRRSESVIVFE